MICDSGEWEGKKFTQEWKEIDSHEGLKPIGQVSAICFNENGEILLVKHPKKGYWTIPGGTPENGESPEETLIREVDEEATCEIEDLKLLGVIKVNFPNNLNEREGETFYQLRFLAKIKNINKHSIDPDLQEKRDRIFIKPEDYFKYVNYGKGIGFLLNQKIISNMLIMEKGSGQK